MGVTIHFEGKLRDEASYGRAVAVARDFARVRGWQVEAIEESAATLKRVRDEEAWDYQGPTRGVELRPHENADPLRLEFDADLYVQEFCKTQFAPADVHVQVVELLALLEAEFLDLAVYDEGDYWTTHDRAALEGHLAACFAALESELARDESLIGPVRGPRGRIFDLVSR